MIKVLPRQSIGNSTCSITSMGTIAIALRLQKSAKATGMLTFQLLDFRNKILASEVISVDTIELGIHWYRFRSIPVDDFLIGQKFKIRVSCSHSHSPENALYWRSGMLHSHRFVYHRGVLSINSDLAVDISYTDDLTGNVYKEQQLEDKCGFMLSSNWTWQEFVIPEH